jgi:rhamnulokinase
MPKHYLALDLGAESGRAILGKLDNRKLSLSDVHRFPNGPIRVMSQGRNQPPGADNSSIHWDILRLWSEIKQGISLAGKQAQEISGIGLDTWGVDFALLDRRGALVSTPYHYRDNRTDGMLEEAFKRLPREKIFDYTGIQFMQINTLYQLLSMSIYHPELLQAAETFLTIPDLFNYWLTGKMVCEFTNTTTTQCYDPLLRNWSAPLLNALGIPPRLFPDVIQPGNVLGSLAPVIAEEVGFSIPVIAPACHDTGSAVAAVPAEGDDFAWISSGTWSIMGTETPEAVITHASLANNFTNEGGIGGTYRFSKNIMGLWLIQQSKRTWASGGEDLSYTELTNMAATSAPLLSVIDPDCNDFLKPGNMPERIKEYCRRTGQFVPETKGAIIRTALEGIALKYRWVLEKLEEMVGHRLEPIYIVGGGTQNKLLSQMTADATGRMVITGPIEATASGNILAQALALGDLHSVKEIREIVRNSFDLMVFEPTSNKGWDKAFNILKQLL